MNWQDLKDDVEFTDGFYATIGIPPGDIRLPRRAVDVVARRVLDLFRPCEDCDNGWLVERGGLMTKAMRCFRCGGATVVYSAKGRELSPGNALARYLFGEG